VVWSAAASFAGRRCRTIGSTPDLTAPRTFAAPLHILVAEDNKFNSRHLERLLGMSGHHIRLAKDGREALALLGVDG
jgi:PleD family two-component response regulator